nr:RNA-directed DNA polymerase, eukaryota [Tanacetum cinerariifolium]
MVLLRNVRQQKKSLPFPPGFTPDKDECQDDVPNNDHGYAGVKSLIRSHSEDLSPRVMEDAQPTNAHESNKGGKDPISGGSILEVLENMIKVGNAMGFSMEGCSNDIVNIIGSQEFSITSKRVLWEYVASLISHWDGHCLVLGDFNEVRCSRDRMGTVFNAHGAKDFNRFISNSGLVELQLEGFSFTWSHPSAKKMSKLNYEFPTKLSPDQASDLERTVSNIEVRNAVWDCGDNKSPGPDGFTFEFFHGPFIINELLSWCKQKKQKAMVFKVDLAKAYDSVRWDFFR